jgi:hypothetical protein
MLTKTLLLQLLTHSKLSPSAILINTPPASTLFLRFFSATCQGKTFRKLRTLYTSALTSSPTTVWINLKRLLKTCS